MDSRFLLKNMKHQRFIIMLYHSYINIYKKHCANREDVKQGRYYKQLANIVAKGYSGYAQIYKNNKIMKN